jgi:tRNA(Leu) C34 or U34 (ribose-2'-O)-methylase TrmL
MTSVHIKKRAGDEAIGFTVRGSSSYLEYTYESGDWLLFGSENRQYYQQIYSDRR